jgi:DnaK suppressor protein
LEEMMHMNSQLTKRHLEAKLQEFANPAGWRDSIAVSTTADPLDTNQRIFECEMASRGLSRNASRSRDLRAAIGRVDEGTYGICVDCEEPIASRRLEAVPWACRCRACQESFENAESQEQRLAA